MKMRQAPPGSLRSTRYHILSILHTVWTWAMMGHQRNFYHTPKGHFLFLRGTEPCSFFQKTQPAPSPPPTQIPQGPCSCPVPPFFRGSPFEGPIPLFSLCPNLSPWPRDFSAFSSCFLSFPGTFLLSFGVAHSRPLLNFHRVLLPPML